MPGIVKVRVVAGKDLPVMDRASDLTDAFAEVRLANATFKTDVCRKTLFPHWNSEWFRFEVDDEELLDEPVQIKVLDHDLYSAHDVIGKVSISLAPLLLKDGASEIGGWFPIYDTLHGIRGYVNVRVRVDFFVDSNRYNQASTRVKFFYTSGVPYGYKIVTIQGFVDALLVNDDPEYQWIDKIRTPRASNEARLRLFAKLSGEVHRRIGQKVSEANGNAVIGYHQSFDIEGESGIVVRGIGTAVTIIKEDALANIFDQHSPDGTANPSFQSINENAVLQTSGDLQPSQAWLHSSGKFLCSQLLRYRTVSSSSDGADLTENQTGLNTAMESPDAGVSEKLLSGKFHGHNMMRKGIEDMEFPFFTIVINPPGFITHLGQIVSARSVKLLDKTNSSDLAETRLMWWHELRTEVKSHAKSLGCNAVIGYSETTTIHEDLIVLTAIGTAVILNLPEMAAEINHMLPASERISDQNTVPLNLKHCRELRKENAFDEPNTTDWTSGIASSRDGINANLANTQSLNCLQCHVPYLETELPMAVMLSKCRVCRHGKVPDVLFTTIDPPSDIPQQGRGCFLQARVCRQKKKEKGESLAENISQILPFLEYELHQQLLHKLKIKSMNALFGWKTQISIGDQFVIGLVSATAIFVSALPSPPIFMVAASKHSSAEEERHLMEIQKKILDVTSKNKRLYNLVDTLELPATPPNTPLSQSLNTYLGDMDGDHIDPRGHLDLAGGVKEAYIIEMDDKRNDSTLGYLLDDSYENGPPLFGIQATPGFTPVASENQFLTVFQQRKFTEDDFKSNLKFSSLCEDTLKGLQFKVRALKPCCLVNVTFDVEIPEDDYLQVTVTAAAISVVEESNPTHKLAKHEHLQGSSDLGEDMVFQMDSLEGQTDKTSEKNVGSQLLNTRKPQTHLSESRNQERRPSLTLIGLLPRWIFGITTDKWLSQTDISTPISNPAVVITPQSWLPNHKVNQYLGNINLFFIRESTSIKEDGGSNMFMQSFITEVYSVLKAHVVALSGNAIVGFNLNEIILLDSPHKNQAQCLLNVSGDVVQFQQGGESESVLHVLSPRRRMSSSSGDSLPSTHCMYEYKERIKEGKGTPSVETEV